MCPLRLLAIAGLFVAMTAASALANDSFVYIANAESQSLSVLRLDETTGQLSQVQTLAVGGKLMPVAFDAKNRRLYGALRSAPYRLVSLAQDGANGQLQLLGFSPLAESMANIALTANGQQLLAVSYGGHIASLSHLDNQGLAKSAAQVFSPGHNPHQISLDPQGRFAYVSLLGDDQLKAFAFNAITGRLDLTPAASLALPPGTGPRHFVFAAAGERIYLVGELSGRVYLLKRDLNSGALRLVDSWSLVPEGFSGQPAAADIHLSPDGRFIYASERSSNSLSGFAIDQDTGRLQLLGRWPCETQPRAFALTPSGDWLLVAGQSSNSLGLFARDKRSGKLTFVARQPLGQGPAWVKVVAAEVTKP